MRLGPETAPKRQCRRRPQNVVVPEMFLRNLKEEIEYSGDQASPARGARRRSGWLRRPLTQPWNTPVSAFARSRASNASRAGAKAGHSPASLRWLPGRSNTRSRPSRSGSSISHPAKGFNRTPPQWAKSSLPHLQRRKAEFDRGERIVVSGPSHQWLDISGASASAVLPSEGTALELLCCFGFVRCAPAASLALNSLANAMKAASRPCIVLPPHPPESNVDPLTAISLPDLVPTL